MLLVSGKTNVLSIADDILIAGFAKEGKDHDAQPDKVIRIGR